MDHPFNVPAPGMALLSAIVRVQLPATFPHGNVNPEKVAA